MSTTAHSLKDSSIPKLLLIYAGPAVLGLLINALYNIVDRIFVGQFVGAEGLSAVTMAYPVTLFQLGFMVLFGSGTAVLISKHLGESRPDKAEKVLGNMIAGLLVIILLFTSAGLLFNESLFRAFGARGELLKLSTNYQQIIFLGFPFAFFISLDFACRAEGNPRLPAFLILLSSLINISLDILFMKVLHLGVRGAALATIIAQSVNAILLIRHYLSGKSVVKLIWKNIRLEKKTILTILSLGLAPFIMDIATSFQNVIANNLLIKSGGTYAVAAMGILFSVNVFFLMTALGTSDGMQPIVSFNMGAKRPDRTKQTLVYGLKIVCLIALGGICLLEVFPTQITRIFVDNNPSIEEIANTALQIFALSIPFYMMQIVITRHFQAIHKNRIATFLAILRPFLLFIPIVYFLNGIFGLKGIWYSFVISDSIAALISFLLIRKSTI
jgi:putative MATE family efflux protein